MDADFTTGLGSSLNSRQESYRLTHPDTSDPGTSSNPALTGVDTGTHATLGRTGLDQPEQPVQWSSPLNRRTAPEVDGFPNRTISDFDSVPQRVASDFDSPSYRPANADSGSYRTTADTDSGSYRPAPEPVVNGYRMPSDFDSNSHRVPDVVSTPEPESSGRRAAPEPESSGRRAAPEVAPTSRRAAPEPEVAPTSRRAAPDPEVAQPAPTTAAAKSREFRAEDAPNLDLHHIMRLLVSSHDLDVAAGQAEAGEITVAELAGVARRTRAAAVDLVAAWYGGPDHMRKFGEVLLQAAAETA